MNGTQIKAADYTKLGSANVGIPGPIGISSGLAISTATARATCCGGPTVCARDLGMNGTQIKAADYLKLGGSNVGAPAAIGT